MCQETRRKKVFYSNVDKEFIANKFNNNEKERVMNK